MLDSTEDLIHVDNALMDREFDSQQVLEMISQRGLSYVVSKRMQTSEKAQANDFLGGIMTATKPTRSSTSARTNGTRRR